MQFSQWKDDEGDNISISSQAELDTAIAALDTLPPERPHILRIVIGMRSLQFLFI